MTFPLLQRIQNSPAEISDFSIDELKDLATEIRLYIIEIMSKNGGHLASNLGSVELTIALHTVFSSPEDKFIFDVSHQTYTHKLLTGRYDRFHTVRQYKGLCGFAHPEESSHDHFYAGHAGTALSLGLGMAHMRDLNEGDFHVIPIIGDATLTCGLSLEAFNNLPKNLSRFIVILNDNAMSISKNVGGITNILSRLLNNPVTSRVVHELDQLVSKIPLCGPTLARQGHRFTESMKNLVSDAHFFEQFGFSYIGPVDGHDIKKLIALFTALKNSPVPLLVHLYTRKGQGLQHAEQDPIAYHGARPFNLETCEFLPNPSSQATFPKVFGAHLLAQGKQNSSIVVVTPAMSLGSCLDPFMQAFPERSFDVGIAEGHAVTFCGGLAKEGTHKIICSIYATFLQRAFDNLFHDICLQRLPVLFAIDRAGISGPDGSTHHGIYDIGFLKTMPYLVICQPRNGQLLKELFSAALTWNFPTALRYPNLPTTESDLPLQPRPLGKAEILQEGQDLLIIALGHQCYTAHSVADLLLTKGITSTIVDPIFVKPLDEELFLQLLQKHKRVVTLEEHALQGGFGEEISHLVVRQGLNHLQILHLGIPELFLEQGTHKNLLDELGLTPEKIAQRIFYHFDFSLQRQAATIEIL